MVEFIGEDPDSDQHECPAVWAEPGGMYIRGKRVDPAISERLSRDVAKGEDEEDVWVPDRLFPIVREALDGTFEPGREGKGQPSFDRLVANAKRSIIRLEMRDAYDPSQASSFAEWKQTGGLSSHQWGDWAAIVGDAVNRGVTWRRVRVISKPMSEYMRWEHAVTDMNVSFGEDIRWLWRHDAADLLLPAADCWVFDSRIVRWNFQRGDDTNPRVYTFSSDPRITRDIAGAFTAAWDRATPHTEFKPE
ncbi:hypothetical protein LO762_00390 [Actinocorallia sp. API 0066]|uniref:DUF6879 family protein n=1 Tax=Actinocorallia sp. API 0066 TaxID=2896846 RepID=UPI001E29B4BE|nr:DUF6879 family protein [Actinocorallia sp. API 0066]MCD0447661.1 hypothetical protein [Actinocorallia sp. API 0066]